MRKILASCLSDHLKEPLRDGDWELLIKMASVERLLPQLALHLPEAPPGIREFLEDVQNGNRKRNERILDEALAVAELMKEIEIEPVFLKGCAYLLEGLYPDPGSRYQCDVDLLVPRAQVDEAARILKSQGYCAVAGDRMARFRHHYPPLQRPAMIDGVGYPPVELHHSLAIGTAGRLLRGEEVLRDSRLVKWRGAKVRIPSAPHLLTHLILHSQIHHSYSERIWPPLASMCDLAMLMQHYGARLEWASVRERFRAHGEEPTLLLHLLQVEETFGVSAPFAIRLGWIGRARRQRRKVLNRWPGLRFADPVYLIVSTLSRRFRLLRSVIGEPRAWQPVARMLMRSDFYRRMIADISLR